MDNIVLTGFMGTGKSTVGRALADHLGFEFIDTDALIVERHGSVDNIFSSLGEQAFRALERGVADELATREGVVIATGGRFMLDAHNRAVFDRATVVCLTADPAEIVRRVTADGIEQRPLLAGNPDPDSTVRSLLAERAGAYGAFDQIDTTQRSVDDIVSAVIELVV